MSIVRLLSVTAALEAPRVFEESIKISATGASAERGMVTFDKRALYPGPRTTLAEVCADLGCPDSSDLDPYLGQAHAVYFAVDGDIGKCYLEFTPKTAPVLDLVFMAIKWRGADVKVNHYTTIAHQPHSAKEALVDALVPAGPVHQAMHACLPVARDGTPGDEAVVLHVTETGTRRASVDINMSDVKLTMAQAAPLLSPLYTAYGIEPNLTDANFGHLAAGTDREGAPFATFYYGAKVI